MAAYSQNTAIAEFSQLPLKSSIFPTIQSIPEDEMKFRPTFFLIPEAVLLGYTS